MASLPGQPKALTSHYGQKMWNQDAPRGATRAASNAAPAPPLTLAPPSFANEPNPSTASSWRILPLFEQKLAAAGALALATTFALWKLYAWWRRDGGGDGPQKRDRLRDKFGDVTAPKHKHNSPHKGHSRGARTTPSPPPQQQSQQPASASSSLPARALSSSPASETGNDRYRAFMAEVRVLAEHGVIISAPLDFYLKRERMRESNLRAIRISQSQGRGSQGALHVLTSFDRSCTTLKQAAVAEDGSAVDPATVPNCLTTQSMLDASLPASYSEASRKLFSQFFPLESNPHISAAQREECMREWWTKAHALLSLDEFRLTRNKIAKMIAGTLNDGKIRLRPGFVELLDPVHGLCARFDIPVFVMSGSVHDLIEAILLEHGVRVANTNRGDVGEVEAALCARSPVHLIANPLRWGVNKPVGSIVDRVAQSSPSMSPLSRLHAMSASSAAASLSSSSSLSAASPASLIPGPHAPAAVCLGFDQRFLIHSLNKCYARVLEQPNLARAVSAKCNLILLGNTIADAGMASGAEHRAQVLSDIFEADARAAEESKEQREFALDDSDVFTQPSHAAATAPAAPRAALPAVSSFDVLRIGFLNDASASAHRVDEFKAAYDVVLTGDHSWAFVGHTIAFMCGAEEAQATQQ